MFSGLGCRTKGQDQQDKEEKAGALADLSGDDEEVYTPRVVLSISVKSNRESQGLGYHLWMGVNGFLGVARKLKAARSD